MEKKDKKKKMTKAEKDMLAIRILCGVMGGLMLLGVFAMIFQLVQYY
ncbi:MAG: hypothetical protein IJ292_05595 [Clostridia bacterium]|jgi:hypothetical protein|nr:hypothetical protein [Clostridia bacterium]